MALGCSAFCPVLAPGSWAFCDIPPCPQSQDDDRLQRDFLRMLAALVPTFALSASLPAGACASAPRTVRNGQVSQRAACVPQCCSRRAPGYHCCDSSICRGQGVAYALALHRKLCVVAAERVAVRGRGAEHVAGRERAAFHALRAERSRCACTLCGGRADRFLWLCGVGRPASGRGASSFQRWRDRAVATCARQLAARGCHATDRCAGCELYPGCSIRDP